MASAPVTKSEDSGGGDADRDRRDRLQPPHFGGVSADVAGDPEEHRVPKRQQVGVADQEIERAGEQREAHRLHDEERIGEKRRDHDQGDHDRESDGVDATILARHVRRRRWRLRGPCQAARPNRPVGPDQKDDRHDDEHHRVRRLRVEHFRQPFDDAEHEAGHDRAEDRSHAANHHDREDDGDDVRAHARTDLVDRRGEHAGEGRERDAEAIGQRDHARHVDAEGAHHGRVFGRRAQIGAELGLLDDEPGREAHHGRGEDHPAAIDGQEHEAEIVGASTAAWGWRRACPRRRNSSETGPE